MAIYNRNEQAALENLLRGLPFENGQKWLVNSHLEKENGEYGWGHFAQQNLVTTWGGTVDGIRGLLACGVSPNDPLIEKSIDWIISDQKLDGAFASKEIQWSCVEAAAWVLRTLRQVEYRANPDKIQKTLKFLESSIQKNGGLGTSDKDVVRIYPSVITLWAVHGLSEKSSQIADFLIVARDRTSGGWGYRQSIHANVAMTSFVLYILLNTGYVNADDAICKRAVEFILAEVNSNGMWDNDVEEWVSIYQDRLAEPIRCKHYTSTWAILALLKAGIKPFDHNMLIVRVAVLLVSKQMFPEGSWLYQDTDDNQFTWCTANILLCLNNVRSAIVGPLLSAALDTINTDINQQVPQIQYRNIEQDLKEIRQTIANWSQNKSLLMIEKNMYVNRYLVILLAIVVLLNNPLNTIMLNIFAYLNLQRDSLMVNILSSALWAVGVGAFFFIRKKLQKTK